MKLKCHYCETVKDYDGYPIRKRTGKYVCGEMISTVAMDDWVYFVVLLSDGTFKYFRICDCEKI